MSSRDKNRQNDSQQRLFIERSHVIVKRSGIPLRGKEPVYDNGRRVVVKVEGMKVKRRTLLQVGGLSLLAGLTGGCDSVGGLLGRMFAVPPRETLYFTPNDTFYVVNYMESPFNVSRDLDVEQWRLAITGEVKKPVTLGWRDILNRDSFDQVVTLECIDTLPGGDSLGNAQWRGISLKKLLQDVGADEETARDVVFRAADGYDDSIPFSRAMRGDVMLAYLMNGEKLPKAHGFPLRLVVPGLYGIKNVKWIIEIEVYNGAIKAIGNGRAGPTTARSKSFPASTARAITSRSEDRSTYSEASPSAGPILFQRWN